MARRHGNMHAAHTMKYGVFSEFSTIRGLICAIPVVNRAAAVRAALQVRLPISLIPAVAAVQTVPAAATADATAHQVTASAIMLPHSQTATDPDARAAGIPVTPATDGTVRAAAAQAAAFGRTQAALVRAVPAMPVRTPTTPASTPLPIAAPVAADLPHEKTQGFSLRFCRFTLRIRRCGIRG